MMKQDFTIKIDIEECRWTKVFNGYKDTAEREAFDYMNVLIAQYISDNKIIDSNRQQEIIDSASFSLEYDTLSYETMYAVCDWDNEILASFISRADAEEFILSLAEEWACNIIQFEDSKDILGKESWCWKEDYPALMRDHAETLFIHMIPAFGVEERE